MIFGFANVAPGVGVPVFAPPRDTRRRVVRWKGRSLQYHRLSTNERLNRWPGERSRAGQLYWPSGTAGGHGGVSGRGSRDFGAFRHSRGEKPPYPRRTKPVHRRFARTGQVRFRAGKALKRHEGAGGYQGDEWEPRLMASIYSNRLLACGNV